MGRFINTDAFGVPTLSMYAMRDKNLFAYCDNNPVTRKDDGGLFWHLVIGATIGAIIGGITTAISGGDATDILISVVAGAAGGLLAASGAGVVAEAFGSAAISMVSNATQQVNSMSKGEQESFDTADMLFDGAIGFACGALGGNGASFENESGIMAAGEQLTRRIVSGDNIRRAISYYVKTAHSQGGKFVLTELSKSFGISFVGTVVSCVI